MYIRTLNISKLKDITTGTWTLGPDLDPFLFLRGAQTILENGSLPKIDYMRNVPLGFDNTMETQLLPYMIVWMYKIINLFKIIAKIKKITVDETEKIIFSNYQKVFLKNF